MNKSIFNFILKLLGFSLALFAIHYYVLIQFFEGELILPLWIIYSFNALMVFVVYSVLNHFSKDKNKDMLKLFLSLTIVKMGLVIVLLFPLFFKKSYNTHL